jgi:hypothetical protein
VLLEREEAVRVYKQIVNECRLDSASVCLISPRNDDAVSKGYQLQISSILSGYDKELLKKILERYHLSWKELSDRIIIYKPII